MKKVFYEKVGRRYKPVSEYDNDLLDAFPKGTHIVMCHPGGKTTRYNIDPNYAALIAAGRVAEDAMTKAIHDAGEIRRSRRESGTPITPEQKAAWEHLVDVLGPEAKYLEYASARDVAEAGLKAMQEEAMKLMDNPSVKNAYEHFELMCKLVKEHSND